MKTASVRRGGRRRDTEESGPRVYVSFYDLSGRPFQLSPDPRFFFAGRTQRRVLAQLSHGLAEAEGFLVVTGAVGTGKSTLVDYLLGRLDRDGHVCGKIVTTQIGADDALRLVASAFRLPFEGLDKATLLHTIEVFLAECRRQRKAPLLVVDEAQNMPAVALEELRLLTNLQRDHRPLLQCILLGQPQLRDRIAQTDMEQLRQRVVAACHLAPLDAAETRAYIEHRLGCVGWHDDPAITEAAHALIHRYSGGVPRRINALCGRLLLFGYLEEIHRIDDGVVRKIVQEMDEETGQYGGPDPLAGDPDPGLSDTERPGESVPAAPAPPSGPRSDAEMLEELARRVASLEGP